jgi:hypothetical protein
MAGPGTDTSIEGNVALAIGRALCSQFSSYSWDPANAMIGLIIDGQRRYIRCLPLAIEALKLIGPMDSLSSASP